MATVTLVPWTTEEVLEGGSAWGFSGTPAEALRAVSDGKHAAVGIINGAPDSNPLRGKQWRVEGTGAAFDWSNKTIQAVQVAVNIQNNGPEGSYSVAVVSANETLAYAEQVFNGALASGVGAPTWQVMGGVTPASVIAALLADNYLLSITHYNHSLAAATITAEAARVIVTYANNIRAGMQHSMEA